MSEELVRIAHILRSHGLKGELKLEPVNDYLEDYDESLPMFIETRFGQREDATIERIRFGNDTIVKFKGISDKAAADKYTQGGLLVRVDDLASLPDDSFYVKDLIGLKVVDQNGTAIGTLGDVIENPAHDLYEVQMGNLKKLIPAVPEFIKNVDLTTGVITIHVIPGLIDE